jgi:arabinose-5-phosphate isomerase
VKNEGEDMSLDNNKFNVVKDYLDTFSNEIKDYLSKIQYEAIEEAKKLIIEAERNNKRVHVTGIGKPGHVASYVASLLSSVGTPTYELNGTEAVHGSSGQVLPGDVVIAISNSGETEELKATVETLKRNGAKIVSVTGNDKSWLASKGDVVLYAGVNLEGDNLNKPPRASIVAEIIVLQSLSVLLQEEKELTPEKYVRWHPGGSLGKSIKS